MSERDLYAFTAWMIFHIPTSQAKLRWPNKQGDTMKYISTTLITAVLTLSFATNAAAEQSIENRTVWLEKAVSMIKSGNLTTLEETVKTTLGSEMSEDVSTLMTPLTTLMADHEPIYVDKISHDQMGQSFDQHVFAAYYGNREFLFYSFTFARLESGWQLYALDFADSLSGLE